MARANLDNLPEFALPAGFTRRWYQPGDEAHWRRIHLAADHYNKITPDLFQKQFCTESDHGLQSASRHESPGGMNSALHDLRERQCYLVEPRGEVIGTATAWFNDAFEATRWGRVHWLAIMPEHQGRGLAKPLMTTICRRLRELGHDRAYLSTSSVRIPAINLYLRFGFAPMIRDAEEETVWRELRSRLKPR